MILSFFFLCFISVVTSLGGMLAGHLESGGELQEKDGKKVKIFYGMSSDTAMKKHAGGVAEYRASEVEYLIFLNYKS